MLLNHMSAFVPNYLEPDLFQLLQIKNNPKRTHSYTKKAEYQKDYKHTTKAEKWFWVLIFCLSGSQSCPLSILIHVQMYEYS